MLFSSTFNLQGVVQGVSCNKQCSIQGFPGFGLWVFRRQFRNCDYRFRRMPQMLRMYGPVRFASMEGDAIANLGLSTPLPMFVFTVKKKEEPYQEQMEIRIREIPNKALLFHPPYFYLYDRTTNTSFFSITPKTKV